MGFFELRTKHTDKIASRTNFLKMIRLKTLSVTSPSLGRNSRQNDKEGFLEHASILAASLLLLFTAPAIFTISNNKNKIGGIDIEMARWRH